MGPAVSRPASASRGRPLFLYPANEVEVNNENRDPNLVTLKSKRPQLTAKHDYFCREEAPFGAVSGAPESKLGFLGVEVVDVIWFKPLY